MSYEDRYQRNDGILTKEVQDLLRSSMVAVAGVGGPGGCTAEALVRLGIGGLRLADLDVYEIHNSNRQVGCMQSTLGESKMDVMCSRLQDINPDLRIERYDRGVTAGNARSFVEDVGAVVDTVDYFVPDVRLALHRAARERGAYVFSPPISGFGSLLLCFGPESPTLEELFDYPTTPEEIKEHELPHEKLIGGTLDYLPKKFFDNFELEQPYVSTLGTAAMIAGGVTATQILRCLMYQAQQGDPSLFREYGDLDVVTLPRALRVDGWDVNYCKVVDLSQL